MSKPYFITAAIPYVNGEPHIGHALEFVQVDAIARYERMMRGAENVYQTTGSDENSLKNVRAAEAANEDVEKFVAEKSEGFKTLFPLLNLSFNDFIRTRENRHIEGAQKLWSACKPEDIYKKSYKGLYCVGCEAFYTEEECPDGNCPTHKKTLEVVEEENYFFKLSNYQSQLEELIESDALKIRPISRKNEMLGFIKQGLLDFSISRSFERAKGFGVSVPNDESQVMYVWFDALSNYINVLGYAENDELFKKFWLDSEHRTHITGKDIARFHAIYWPAMLLSAGLPTPTDLYVHGFFTIEGEKMSKSLGNVIPPAELVNDFGVDAMRYFFLREMPYASDGDVSKDRLESRYGELANQLGNLVSRVAAMSQSYFDGELQKVELNFDDKKKLLDNAMQEFDFKRYLDIVFDIAGDANEMIDKKAPFKLVKVDEDGAKQVLAELAEMIRFIAWALLPIMPETAQKILSQYNAEKIEKGEALFPRRD